MPGYTTQADVIDFKICNECSLANTPFYTYPGVPLLGRIRQRRGCGVAHAGALDLEVPNIKIGTPVYAAEAGYINVLSSGNEPCGCKNECNKGNLVSIRSFSDKFITQYVHVTPLPGLKLKDQVYVGQQIGTVDQSGSSCNPHVHMARYTPTGIPTCNWQLRIAAHTVTPPFTAPPFVSFPSAPTNPGGVTADPYLHPAGPGGYHPRVYLIPSPYLYW
ncbi:peptidase M23 [Bacillus cereus]|nr:peptidase M23 [Bacillus cereus]PER56350.1 peptidase M23 [Bacillus cereus]PEW50947.1 peptidase M23 [Bacillus cereus]PEY88590.1 peptidase M23 [Bacillus cereus]PFC15945.1 peptidase M23 [Bacillus cereus]